MATMMRCSSRAAVRPSRSAVVVRASADQPRRALLGMLAGAVAGALLVAPQAEAMRITSQAFTGGLGAGGGNSPKSSTAASMSSYMMEGTKKQGSSVKTKKKL
ncbi:hypothetical protein TSOC_008870 [Tetrabaena socialis]|uniref:Uncharacterized protein n=1 Tax=Tetrabaena socialis TaxID=47790 RepID=A0A2J7ZXA7_9CHLO|nr:hypothetical protein TSOC_008870 [Tetrabaena socialis]|eukprot:PNH04888.1 hypothetical protein TSOC_008870 [Tetrabaena socialis]